MRGATGVRVALLVGLGVVWLGLGLALWPSTWIDSRGIGAAGVALLVLCFPIRTSLDVLVVLAPFMFRVLSPVGLLNLGTSDLLMPVLLAVLLVRTVVEREPGETRPRVVEGAVPLLVAAMVLLTGSLLVWSVADPEFLVSKAVSDTAKLTIGIAYLGLVIVLVRRLGAAATYRAMGLWTWVATGVAGASMVGAVTGLAIVPDDGYGQRSVGFFADPNLYAGYLLLSLAILLFRGMTAPSPLLAGQALVLVGGLVTTGSRGGLATLVLLAAFAAFTISSARLRLAIVAAGLGAVAAALFLVPDDPSSGRVIGVDRLLVSSADSGDDARFDLWRLAVDLWSDHPVFGIGMGQYPRFSVGIVGEIHTSDLGHVVHNSFLNMLVSLGVVGLALFVALFVWVLRRVYAAEALTRSQQHALVAGVLVIAAQMMTLNLENLRYVWLYLGLLMGLSALERQPEEAAPAAARPVLVRTS